MKKFRQQLPVFFAAKIIAVTAVFHNMQGKLSGGISKMQQGGLQNGILLQSSRHISAAISRSLGRLPPVKLRFM